MNSRPHRRALTCLLILGLFAPLKGQQAPTQIPATDAQTVPAAVAPKERVVRSAYEKLTALTRAAQLSKGAAARRSASDDVLTFELRNLRVGPIQEIWNTPARDLATLPSGDIISIERLVTQLNRGAEHVAYEASWTTGRYASGYDPRWTVGDLFGFEAGQYYDVGEYASYEVTVFFKSKTRAYRALALFHNQPGSSGLLKPTFWDNIVGMGGALTEVWNENRPHARSPFTYDNGEVTNWFYNHCE